MADEGGLPEIRADIRILQRDMARSQRQEDIVDKVRDDLADLHRTIVEFDIALKSFEPFTTEERRRIRLMLDNFETDQKDRKDFSRTVKTAIITMLLSGVLFTIFLPVVQQAILGK